MADDDHNTTGRSPAFQFYPNDFTSGTLTLSTEEIGAYILLICHCWDKGSIPADVQLLARIARLTPARMRRVWTALACKFTETDTGFTQPRLERERQKQADYRRRQSDASRKRWDSHGNPKPLPTDKPEGIPNGSSSSSVSSFQSSDFSQEKPEARSKRPVFKGQRLVVFEWMLDDLRRLLGSHFDAFDLHEWFYKLDAQLTEAALVIPQRDGGKWLQEQTMAEAIRRGLPVAATTIGSGKTAGNAAAIARFIARGQQ